MVIQNNEWLRYNILTNMANKIVIISYHIIHEIYCFVGNTRFLYIVCFFLRNNNIYYKFIVQTLQAGLEYFTLAKCYAKWTVSITGKDNGDKWWTEMIYTKKNLRIKFYNEIKLKLFWYITLFMWVWVMVMISGGKILCTLRYFVAF